MHRALYKTSLHLSTCALCFWLNILFPVHKSAVGHVRPLCTSVCICAILATVCTFRHSALLRLSAKIVSRKRIASILIWKFNCSIFQYIYVHRQSSLRAYFCVSVYLLRFQPGDISENIKGEIGNCLHIELAGESAVVAFHVPKESWCDVIGRREKSGC